MSESSDLLTEFCDKVRAEYEAHVVTERDKKIQKIAKHMASANEDPDIIVMGYPGRYKAALAIAGNGTFALAHPIQPAWATYWRDASAALEAVEAAEK